MKIFLVTNEHIDAGSYDTYDSMVVVAENKEDAKKINPRGVDDTEWEKGTDREDCYAWPGTIENIKAECIGKANPEQKRGVVCASFNAG